jgi:hypothetical protein
MKLNKSTLWKKFQRFKHFEIKNKNTILNEIDKSLGKTKPPGTQTSFKQSN